ncbi:MAG TPA: hypothetical protein VGE67_08450 [Haloferula sp.]
MKKRTAVILFGSLLCGMGGYVAWCCRSFHVKPRLAFEYSVSAGGRKAMDAWREMPSYPAPLAFSWSTMWENLCHPWHCRMADPVHVNEDSRTGLWATNYGNWWGFSKSRGEWDGATAKNHGIYFFSYVTDRIERQGEIATRIDVMAAKGATIEIVSLGGLRLRGEVAGKVSEDTSADPYFPIEFHHYEVMGSVRVVDSRERQHLLDCLARSIREADVDHDLPGWGISPRHGIILTLGGERADYLINFEDGDAYAFGSGIDGVAGFDRGMFPARRRGSEERAFLRISSIHSNVFDDVLKKSGVEQGRTER